jgi:glycyl-tRNA synthetase
MLVAWTSIVEGSSLASVGMIDEHDDRRRTPRGRRLTSVPYVNWRRANIWAMTDLPTQSTPLTMQGVLQALRSFWADHGCMEVQAYNTEVGAGTGNPATSLRVLGPEPWRVAYVEPSVRPDDSRYGENPNRLQTHSQFQVILKPDPGNPQELYLGSLVALGIDIRAHDVRFVEDNWASPALGAWGLGWEVWLDGLEITQFTYFQQAGGMTLNPVSVEITYGIERIVMALQGVPHFKDIAYAPGISYGEVFGQSEFEMSTYYLDKADVATHRTLFEQYAAEARRMLEAQLPVPAYNYALKCSQTFNVLDARGAISTTERATAFADIRALTRGAAKLWASRREEIGYPLGTTEPAAAAVLPTEFASQPTRGPAPVVFEIGTEEMPPSEARLAGESVRNQVRDLLGRTRLDHGPVEVYVTPRRIVVTIADVAVDEPESARRVRGPKVSIAFDDAGSPTKAALGFARANQRAVTDLVRFEFAGHAHIGLDVTAPGRVAAAVLSEVFSTVVLGLRSEKNMRWSDPKLSFTRPVRWLLALHGQIPVPVAASALSSGNTTRVHRTADSPEVVVAEAAGFLELLESHGIVADAGLRREQIVVGARRLARSVGGDVDAAGETALVEEITYLVEQPTPVLGTFDSKYLELPAAILMTVMRKHQRYLPVTDDGRLLPHFVAIANGDCDIATARAGFESVLRARYEDAAFFWRADLATPIDTFTQSLNKLTFEVRLGSVADRAQRISAIAGRLAEVIALGDADSDVLDRAGELVKFDLGTQMVIELSSLAGTMAREYALRAGESAAVAQALFETELPRQADGPSPETVPGGLLALADRLDLLAGLFALGEFPTGTSDPFALRRAAGGVVTILRRIPRLRGISLETGIGVAVDVLAGQSITVPESTASALLEFVRRRWEQQLLDAGTAHHQVQAVLPLADRPAMADDALVELPQLESEQAFGELVAALQRVHRILPEHTPADYRVDVLQAPAEIALHRVFVDVASRLSYPSTARTGDTGLGQFAKVVAELVAPINQLFDDVLVMTADDAVRSARLGLLASIDALAARQLDWNAL